jgi:hypothetical protein
MRAVFAAAILVPIMTPALAQTQPTRPSAYPTLPTLTSAWVTAPLSPCRGRPSEILLSLNPTSPCYSGTPYPSYSATQPFDFNNPSVQRAQPSSVSLSESQAWLRMVEKGYDVSKLEKDKRGIWRGQSTLDDGRPVQVTLDLQGNIYSTPSRLYIGPPSNR